MKKQNCWEFMKCGRESDGKNTEKLGACPAAVETKTAGIHGGKNAGRCCWVIAGTFCEGKVHGTFIEKFGACVECPFYKLVTREEKIYLTASEITKEMERKKE